MLTTVKHNPNLNRPEYITNKAEYIRIGGHTSYPFPTDAAMAGSRGDKNISYALPVNAGKDPTPAGSLPPLTI